MKLFFISTLSVATPLSCTNQPKADKAVETSKNNGSSEISVISLNDADFRKLIFDYDRNKEWKYEGNMPAIVDFYADWCAPCRYLSPIVEEIAKEYAGKIVVYKVDTEKETNLTQKIGITALPTLLFIPASGKPQVSTGVLPKESLVKAVNEILKVK